MSPLEQPGALQLLQDRLRTVRDEVCAAAGRAGRDPAAVKLVVVTKTAPPGIFPLLRAAGVCDVGESRVQVAETRRADGLRPHFVGHLQSNKVPRALTFFDVFHGVDSLALLDRLDAAAAGRTRRPELLLQVNVSGEASKHGFSPGQLPAALDRATGLRHVLVTGLMTMAPLSVDPEQARGHFRALASLRDRCARPAAGLPLNELSMGMSDDFSVAVEEGATLIRIGRRLVDGVLAPDSLGTPHAMQREMT